MQPKRRVSVFERLQISIDLSYVLLFLCYCAEWRERNEANQMADDGLGARSFAQKNATVSVYGLNLLPKGDVVRKLAEQMETRHRQFTKAFRNYDRNHDGKLSYEEFKVMLISLGIAFTEEEFIKLFRRIDINGSGTIDPVAVSYTHLTLPTKA